MDLIQALLPTANQILVKTIRFWETIYTITIKSKTKFNFKKMQILLTLIRQINKYKNNLRVHFTLNYKIVKLILNQKFKDLKI